MSAPGLAAAVLAASAVGAANTAAPPPPPPTAISAPPLHLEPLRPASPSVAQRYSPGLF